MSTTSHSRRSLAGRISMGVASRLSVVGTVEEARTGTVFATTINTLCSVMGAGVLTLPLALYNTSIVPGILLLTYVTLLAAFAVYCLVCGCDRTHRFSMTEVIAFALYPPQTFEEYASGDGRNNSSGSAGGGGGAAGGGSGGSPASPYAVPSEELRAAYRMEELRRRQWRRRWTLLTELIIFCSNFGFLIIYGKVIMESMPPVVVALFGRRGSFLEDEMFWLVSSGVVFFFLSCQRNMEELKWTSLIGFLTIQYIVVCVVYRYHTARTARYPDVSPDERGALRVMELHPSIFRGFTTFGMAISYHYNVPYFYKEMRRREPSEMMRSVLLAFPIIALSYALEGLFGYLTFGDQVANKRYGGNIVLHYASHDLLINIGRFGLFFHFLCVFPIVAICTRRALHRIIMTLLVFPEQTRRMREAAGLVPAGSSGDDTQAAHPVASEATPLLGTPANAPRARTPEALLGGVGEGDAELDKDPGAIEDTTQLAIVLETLVLVTASGSLAASVSGIDVVVDVIGMLFSVYLVFIGPALVGFAVLRGRPAVVSELESMTRLSFSGMGGRDAPVVIASTFRFVKVKLLLCVVSIITGVLLTAIGLGLTIKDRTKRT